jgi:hypothetical protein
MLNLFIDRSYLVFILRFSMVGLLAIFLYDLPSVFSFSSLVFNLILPEVLMYSIYRQTIYLDDVGGDKKGLNIISKSKYWCVAFYLYMYLYFLIWGVFHKFFHRDDGSMDFEVFIFILTILIVIMLVLFSSIRRKIIRSL